MVHDDESASVDTLKNHLLWEILQLSKLVTHSTDGPRHWKVIFPYDKVCTRTLLDVVCFLCSHSWDLIEWKPFSFFLRPAFDASYCTLLASRTLWLIRGQTSIESIDLYDISKQGFVSSFKKSGLNQLMKRSKGSRLSIVYTLAYSLEPYHGAAK